jgi:excisionase family DNA binding protein
MQMSEKKVYTVTEMAQVLNIGKNLAYELIHRQGFPKVVVGQRKILIPIKALDLWLESNVI